ncbi:uncharacterized protein METZ01_LOCUS216460 [marine metagenome]|uniref:Uncharacterized protein n=1 Tax=marine metagenome TaxID=408172 RepID=A0A382FKH8_9ZZZZ
MVPFETTPERKTKLPVVTAGTYDPPGAGESGNSKPNAANFFSIFDKMALLIC